MNEPLDRLIDTLAETGMTRLYRRYLRELPDLMMKDLTVEAMLPDRTFRIGGSWVVNFGSDSFLGLDQDPRLHAAIERGLREWGTHNGSSRAFSSVELCVRAERKIADWIGTEASLIYPSVTLVNQGAIPGLVTRHDVVVADQFAHNSIDEGLKIAKGRGVRTAKFAHNNPAELQRVLQRMKPYRFALIAVDGVYSMSGALPPLAEFRQIAQENNGILYVDDAHGTGILGENGRGSVHAAIGDYSNIIVVGSLSKVVACYGGFLASTQAACDVLKLRSNPWLFGGPIPPPYLDGVCTAIDILNSPEYVAIRSRLDNNIQQLVKGARQLGFDVLDGLVPIISIGIGEEETTLHAGRYLFESGYYVQSVIFPAVPHGAGVIRIQVNANHTPNQIDGLLHALGGLRQHLVRVERDEQFSRLRAAM